jgi:tyrosyl-tRNA synthetase
MTAQDQLARIKARTEDIMTEGDLQKMLESSEQLNHYIGFEISGKIHLGTGLVCMQKVKDFQDAGVNCHVFLADWHTWINDKLGGDRAKIKQIAVGYFQEGLKIAFKCLGGNPDKLTFVLGSELYSRHPEYWDTVVEVSKHTTLSRMKRSITILGRKEGDEVDFAKLMYPAMQVADIFVQGIHIAHAGMDQRKAQVIARDVADKMTISPLRLGNKIVKPVAVHHHLLLGLQKPTVWPIPSDMDKQDIWSSMKMSKSKPDSAVFIHDDPEEIQRKVMKAFCPEKETEFNPVLDWAEHLIFSRESSITIKRDEKFGGNLSIGSFPELAQMFREGRIHPQDLKQFVAEYLIELLAPVREHFSKGEGKKMLDELETCLVTKG